MNSLTPHAQLMLATLTGAALVISSFALLAFASSQLSCSLGAVLQ